MLDNVKGGIDTTKKIGKSSIGFLQSLRGKIIPKQQVPVNPFRIREEARQKRIDDYIARINRGHG